jgi:hypothetical protein
MAQANKIILTALLALAAAVASCSKLPLQQSHKYAPTSLDRRQGVDCWSYIQSASDLATMKEAIEKCGMQDYYSQSDRKCTYLLLDETAFFTYILPSLEVGDIGEAPVDKLKDILLFHIIKGEYDSYNGAVGYDPVYVLTMWQDVNAVMTIKLDDSVSKSNRQQDRLTLMEQCGRSTAVKATSSDLLMTNGPAHILSRNCVYKP